tara:strand:- start:1109 stop:2275 length:1167 start_codon:yes stop_codon:yes gene_type:complete
MSLKKNYGDSHDLFVVSSKRFDISPYISKYYDKKIVFGISANRFYPLSNGKDPIESYWNLRKNVVLYDVPEKPLEISGSDSLILLEKVFSRTISDLKINRARYAIACNYDGGIIMDGILIRLSSNKFWYIHADGNFETWLLAHSEGLKVNIRDPKSWAIQIQGPSALKVLKNCVTSIDIEKFKYFHCRNLNFGGQNFLVSRTGWTGELGFEIYSNGPQDDHLHLWDYIMERGKDFNIKTSSLDSMGIRRIEAGILDYGTDMNRFNNPFEVGLGKFIDLSKGFFIGKDKLLTVNKKTKLFGIICQNIIPFSGLKIFYKNKIVGQTTVGAFSPYFGKGIGYALFNYNNNWIEKKLYIKDHENNLHDCQIVTLPFFDESKKIPKLVNANLS